MNDDPRHHLRLVHDEAPDTRLPNRGELIETIRRAINPAGILSHDDPEMQDYVRAADAVLDLLRSGARG
jgi:hypothetical protein